MKGKSVGTHWWGPVTPLFTSDIDVPEFDHKGVGGSSIAGKHLPGEGLPSVSHLRWQDRGACVGQDVNMFVPENTRGPINEPMSFCAECPVREQCLDFALEHDEKGIWGGTTDRQREYIKQGHIHPCPEGCGRAGYGTNNEKCTPCANWARGARTRGKKAIAA